MDVGEIATLSPNAVSPASWASGFLFQHRDEQLGDPPWVTCQTLAARTAVSRLTQKGHSHTRRPRGTTVRDSGSRPRSQPRFPQTSARTPCPPRLRAGCRGGGPFVPTPASARGPARVGRMASSILPRVFLAADLRRRKHHRSQVLLTPRPGRLSNHLSSLLSASLTGHRLSPVSPSASSLTSFSSPCVRHIQGLASLPGAAGLWGQEKHF